MPQVPEVHIYSGQNQTQTQSEAEQLQEQRDDEQGLQPDVIPVEDESQNQDEGHVDRECHGRAHQGCDHEDPSWKVGLAKHVRVGDHGRQRGVGCLIEEEPDDDADEQLRREILLRGDPVAEQEEGKDQIHHPVEHQRLQQRPDVP